MLFLLFLVFSYVNGWIIGNYKGYKKGIEDRNRIAKEAFNKAIIEFKKAIRDDSDRSKD